MNKKCFTMNLFYAVCPEKYFLSRIFMCHIKNIESKRKKAAIKYTEQYKKHNSKEFEENEK